MWQVWRAAEFLPLLARRSLDPGLIWATIGLASLLLASAAVVVLVNRWRKQNSCDAGSLDYQSLFEQGLLSREELERIRGREKHVSAPASPPRDATSAVEPPATDPSSR